MDMDQTLKIMYAYLKILSLQKTLNIGVILKTILYLYCALIRKTWLVYSMTLTLEWMSNHTYLPLGMDRAPKIMYA